MRRFVNEQFDILKVLFTHPFRTRGSQLYLLYFVGLLVYFGWSQNVWGAGMAIGFLGGYWIGRLSEMPQGKLSEIYDRYHGAPNDTKSVPGDCDE